MSEDPNTISTSKAKTLTSRASSAGSSMVSMMIGIAIVVFAGNFLRGDLIYDWSPEGIAVKIALVGVSIGLILVPFYMMFASKAKYRHYKRSAMSGVRRMERINTKSIKGAMASMAEKALFSEG